MNKQFFFLMFFALAVYGQQQERVAIINTVDDRDSIGFSDLSHLTNRLRETAVKVLPKSRYGVMTTESIVAFLGSQERAQKECREASCLAELGRKVSADYVAQARIGRFGNQLSINCQLYNSKSGNLIYSFTGNSKDIFGLLAIIDEKAPDLFKNMPDASGSSSVVSSAIVESPNSSGNSFIDSRDGKKYRTVKMPDGKIWMAENLNYNANGSKCYKDRDYPDETANCKKYGRLYDYETAMKACPRGWHLPSDNEWYKLKDEIGDFNAGKYLKAKNGWIDVKGKNSNGEDKFGFSALPGGSATTRVGSTGAGEVGYWLSSDNSSWEIRTSAGVGSAYGSFKHIFGLLQYNVRSTWSFSVRCVQD